MNIDQAVTRACQEPTLLDALSWICVWENDRAVKQATERHGSGAKGAGWDTCFKVCIKRVMESYDSEKRMTDIYSAAGQAVNALKGLLSDDHDDDCRYKNMTASYCPICAHRRSRQGYLAITALLKYGATDTTANELKAEKETETAQRS